MPHKPPTPCAQPGCPALSHERFCNTHGDLAQNEWQKRYDETRPSASNRGYGWRWQKLRRIVLAEEPICRVADCTQASEEVDHILPLSRGGTNRRENLQGLCKSHHSKKTQREMRKEIVA